jgi:hypothetical protein
MPDFFQLFLGTLLSALFGVVRTYRPPFIQQLINVYASSK